MKINAAVMVPKVVATPTSGQATRLKAETPAAAPLRKYVPLIPKPVTVKEYDLLSHWNLNRR